MKQGSPAAIRVARRGWSAIPNSTLRDRRLSWAARGVLGFLLSHADGWRVTIDSIVAECEDEGRGSGRDAVAGCLRRLEACGYVSRRRVMRDHGYWATETLVFASAVTVEEADAEWAAIDAAEGAPLRVMAGVNTGNRAARTPSPRPGQPDSDRDGVNRGSVQPALIEDHPNLKVGEEHQTPTPPTAGRDPLRCEAKRVTDGWWSAVSADNGGKPPVLAKTPAGSWNRVNTLVIGALKAGWPAERVGASLLAMYRAGRPLNAQVLDEALNQRRRPSPGRQSVAQLVAEHTGGQIDMAALIASVQADAESERADRLALPASKELTA